MHLLLNVLFGVLAGILTDYLLNRLSVNDPLKLVIAVIVGVLVFLADLASRA